MIPSFSHLYLRYKNSLCTLLDHGAHRLWLCFASSTTVSYHPQRPRCQDGRVCVLRPVRLKNLLAFGTIADYQMAEDIGSQWGEGPSVLKQFFPLWHVCIVLKDNLLLMYHAVDWGLFCTLSSAFHGPEMSAASVNFGRNSVLSQRASEIMMSGITLLPHPYHIHNFLSLRFCLFVLKTELPLAALTELALTL